MVGVCCEAVFTAAVVGATHHRRWGQGYVADGSLELVYRGCCHGAVGRQGLDLDLELLAVVLVFLGLIGGEEMGLDFGGRWNGETLRTDNGHLLGNSPRLTWD